MTEETLLYAMAHVDAALIDEAETYAPAKQKRSHWKAWGGMAACLALVLAGTAMMFPQQPGTMIPPDAAIESASTIVVDLEVVHVNTIDTMLDSSRIFYDPEQYEAVTWDREDIVAYYGWDLIPAYIPAGLKASSAAPAATVYYEKGGSIAEDTVGVGFYHAYYADGSPMLTEDVAAVKGFSLRASKLGIVQCGILVENEDMQPTIIGGAEVLIGYRAMEYGPYDPDTHEPSGTYDLYVAEFTLDGVEYFLETDQLPLEEVVKIVASILCETADVSITGAPS